MAYFSPSHANRTITTMAVKIAQLEESAVVLESNMNNSRRENSELRGTNASLRGWGVGLTVSEVGILPG